MNSTLCEDYAGHLYQINADGTLTRVKRPLAQTSEVITDTAQRIYAYIVRYKAAHDGNSPTIREICDECGVSSTSVVAYNLDKLERAGKIVLAGGGARGIQVVGGRWSPPQIVEPQP